MRRRQAAALVLFVAFAAAAAILLTRAAPPAYPISDIALTELYTREAARGRLLVGPYSRFGWHHPGPLLFYLLAPAYVLGGQNTAALHAGAFGLSLIVVTAMLVTATRGGEPSLALAVTAAVAVLTARVSSIVVSPWNPHAVVLPALALIVAAAAAAAGATRLLLLVVALASFVAQADVALVPFAAVVSLAPLVVACRSRRVGVLVAAAAVGAVLWLLPVVEQLSHAPGNLAALWTFFASGSGPRLGFTPAIGVWSDALTAPLRPGFTLAHGATLEPAVAGTHVAVASALAAGAAIASVAGFRGGRPARGWFGALSALSSIVAFWSVTRIEGVVSDHLAFWQAAIGLADAAAVAAWLGASACSRFEARGWSRAAGAAVAVAPVLAAVLGLQEVSRAARGSFAITLNAPSAPNFAASIREYLARNNVRRPLVRIDQGQWGLAAAILLQLDRERVRYAVEDDWKSMFPDRFAANGREDAELTLAAAGEHADLADRPGNVTVDTSSFLHVEAVPAAPSRR